MGLSKSVVKSLLITINILYLYDHQMQKITQQIFSYPKSIIEILQKGVKYVQR